MLGLNTPAPEGVRLFYGSNWSDEEAIFLNIYGKKHEEEYWFCVDLAVIRLVTRVNIRIQKWESVAEYIAHHREFWTRFDMEPNPDFNIGVGLRGANGEHLNGSSEVCESDGRLELAAIQRKCDEADF